MTATPPTARGRRRTVLGLLLGAGLILGVLHAVLAEPPSPGEGGASDVRPNARPTAPSGSSEATRAAGQRLLADEDALARSPMPLVGKQAASPQPIAADGTVAPFVLPPGAEPGPPVVGGFPATPEGAIAQLAALDVVALHDLDPQSYASAYRSISLPGAPDPSSSPLGAEVTSAYRRISVNATDPVPISSRWQPVAALVKGGDESGTYLVVCVLGELDAAAQNSAAAGVGDCQALRYGPPHSGARAEWRIAAGPPAAAAPDTWPGSTTAIAVGYRPVAGTVPAS